MSQVFSVPVRQPSDGLAFQGFYMPSLDLAGRKRGLATVL